MLIQKWESAHTKFVDHFLVQGPRIKNRRTLIHFVFIWMDVNNLYGESIQNLSINDL